MSRNINGITETMLDDIYLGMEDFLEQVIESMKEEGCTKKAIDTMKSIFADALIAIADMVEVDGL